MAMTRFERRRVDEYDRDEAALRRDERNVGRMEREQAIRDREADVYNAARRRRLESQNLTALADPGRYAPQVYRQAKQWEDESNLRAHERKMLEQQGANELAVAEQKRFGMKEQGMDAAGIAAKTELAKAEEEWGARKSIAQTDAETKRYGFDKDFEGKKYGADKDLEGKKYGFDKDFEGKKYGADASVRSAEAQARERARIAEEERRSKEAIAAGNNETRITTAEIRSGGQAAQREQAAFDSWVKSAMRADSQLLTPAEMAEFRKMSPDEQKAFWRKKTGRGVRGTGTASQDGKQGGGKSWRNLW